MKYNKEDHFKTKGVEVRGKIENVRKVQIGEFYCLLNNKTYSTLG